MLRKTLVGMAAALALCAGSASALAQGTAFTYQGQLKNSGAAVNSATDMQFSLWNDPALSAPANQVGSTVTNLAVPVSSGLFSSAVNFGVNPYTASQNLYLQIAVRNPAGSGSYVPMGSRQLLTPAPFSLATRGINVNANGRAAILTQPVDDSATLTLGTTGGQFPASSVRFRGDNGRLWDMSAFSGTGTDFGGFTISRSGVDFPFVIDGTTSNILLNQQASGGNVGIGTSTPQAKLDVSGTSRLNGATQIAGSGSTSLFVGGNDTGTLTFPASATASDKAGIRIYNDFIAPGSSKIQGWDYNTNVARLLTINPDGGNVGIGTASPAAKLQVEGGNIFGRFVPTAASPNLLIGSPTATTDVQSSAIGFLGSGILNAGIGYTPSFSAPSRIDFGFSAPCSNAAFCNSVFTINSNGNVGIGIGIPTQRLHVIGNILATGSITPSCAKLKENVIPMGDALDKLSHLSAVRFDWKADEAKTRGFTHDLGFIAEDVAKVFPEVVFRDEKGEIMGLDYSRMSAVAVGAIKQLKNENDQLKARLEKLEALVAAQSSNAAAK